MQRMDMFRLSGPKTRYAKIKTALAPATLDDAHSFSQELDQLRHRIIAMVGVVGALAIRGVFAQIDAFSKGTGKKPGRY